MFFINIRLNQSNKLQLQISQMWSCGRDYCPHIHDKRCLKNRLKQIIPYTIFPDGTIDSFTNVHIRCSNNYKSSIPTVAYENFKQRQIIQDDRNFIKDFYLQNCPINGVETMGNHIVEQLKEDMLNRNAYVLAGQENIKFLEDQEKKKRQLDNAKRRAVSRYNDHFNQLALTSKTQKEQNAKWLQKLYRKLEEVAKHIIQGEGQSLGDREKMFLLSKNNLTPKYLSQIKIRNPKAAFDMLQQLRTLMCKKKLKYQDQREEQQRNKSVTMSFTSQASQNTSQGSMISQVSVNESKAGGQDDIVQKYCDFEILKKKWKLEDVENVRQMIRRILTKQKVSEAQLQAVKNKKEALKNNQKIRSKQKSPDQKNIKKNKSEMKKKETKKETSFEGEKRPIFKETLTKQDKAVKDALLKGGQFDAIGEIFQRNRNYSQMFKRKKDQAMPDLSFKSSSHNNNTTLTLNNISNSKVDKKETKSILKDSGCCCSTG